MKTVTFTEFRKNASGLLTEVEQGETLVVLRRGHPVAEVSPVAALQPSWKRPGPRLSGKKMGLTQAILEEREHEDLL